MVRKHGHQFHTLYWTLIELLHCHGVGDRLTIDWRDLSNATQIRTSKLRSCLDDSEAKCKVIVTSSNDHVEIQIPKFRERQGKTKTKLASTYPQTRSKTPLYVEGEGEGEREEDKEPPYSPPKGGDAFEQFWNAYPSPKSGKIKARESWDRKRKDGQLPSKAVILAGLDRFRRSQRCADGFVAAPAVWLNGGRWDDDLPLERNAAFLADPPSRENGHGRTIDTAGVFSDQDAVGGDVSAGE